MRFLVFGLFVALLASAPGSARAQVSMPPQPGTPQMSPETRARIQEFQTIQQRLDQVREQALKDEKLAKKQEALQTEIETEMKKLDPNAAKNLKRFDELKDQFEAARQSGDSEKARSLVGELQSLTAELREAQTKAMETKKVSAALGAFSDDLFAAMVKIEPEAKEMRARAQILVQELRAAAPQGPMQ